MPTEYDTNNTGTEYYTEIDEHWIMTNIIIVI